MNIKKASPSDLVEVLYLLHVCIQEMNCKGWYYWDLQNLPVKEDIDHEIVYIYKENETCLGMLTMNSEEIADYKKVNWDEVSGKHLIVHRLIVHPNWRHQGIAKKLISFAEQYAEENAFSSLRLDVFSENTEAVSLYKQLNYKHSGDIEFWFQKVPYYCFEKIIGTSTGK